MYDQIRQFIDDLKKQFEETVDKSMAFSVFNKMYDLDAKEIVEYMFYDVLIDYYADVSYSERRRKVKINNLKINNADKDNEDEECISSADIYTTYNKVRKRYKKLFPDNTEFFSSETEKVLAQKLFRKKTAKIDIVPIIFALYIINKLYVLCSSNNSMSAFNEEIIKRFRIDNILQQLEMIFKGVLKDQYEAYYYCIKFTSEFFKDFKEKNILEKLNVEDYCMLIGTIYPMLSEMYCAYTGIIIGSTLINEHKSIIEDTLKNIERKEVPLKKAVSQVLKRINTLDSNPDFDIDKDKLKEWFDFTVKQDKELVSGRTDVSVRNIEQQFHKYISKYYSERVKRKQAKNIKKLDENLIVEQLENNGFVIDTAYFKSPEEIKWILKSFRENAVKLLRDCEDYSMICSILFQQAFCLCDFLKDMSSDIYHKNKILECVSDILYAKIGDDASESLMYIIECNLCVAYRNIMHAGLNDLGDSLNIHMLCFTIKCIIDIIVYDMDKYQIDYLLLWTITSNVLKVRNLLYDEILQIFNGYVEQKNKLSYLEYYINQNNILNKSYSCLRNFYELDTCEGYFIDVLVNAF